MDSEKFNNNKDNERVFDINAEERMPAVNSAPAIVDILREAIERAADNERKKVRRELFTINAVVLVFLIGIAGIFLMLAYNLVQELRVERNMSRDMIIAAMERTRIGGQKDDPELNRTLRDILSAWDSETNSGTGRTEKKPETTSKDSSQTKSTGEKAEPEETSVTLPAPMASQPEPGRSIRAEVEDLETEEEAIAILITDGKPENTVLLTSMIEERDKALAQLRERIKKTHSNMMDKTTDEPDQPETVPVEKNESESQTDLSRYISINAAGTEMRILTPAP